MSVVGAAAAVCRRFLKTNILRTSARNVNNNIVDNDGGVPRPKFELYVIKNPYSSGVVSLSGSSRDHQTRDGPFGSIMPFETTSSTAR